MKLESVDKDAIVFSSFIPDSRALEIGRSFLRVFEKYFSNCDIYIGINHGSLDEWEDEIIKSSLNIYYKKVQKNLTIDSDASGFQAALELLKTKNLKYRMVWFGHTKGATENTSDRDQLRKYFIEDFFARRKNITSYFIRHKKLGAFGLDISILPTSEHGRLDKDLEKIVHLPFKASNIYYLHTFYVLRGAILNKFLKKCKSGFFHKNIVTELGFDRWFFERNFAIITEKQGYYMQYARRHNHLSDVPVTRAYVVRLIKKWEKQLPKSKPNFIFYK